MKSYLLQEAEAVSRGAKMAWCEQNRVRVTSLQHDGIMVAELPQGLSAEEVAEQLTIAATSASGFEVVVEAASLYPAVVD